MSGVVLFPLYDELYNEIKDSNITTVKLSTLCTTINSLPVEFCNNIYLLILHHYMSTLTNDNKSLQAAIKLLKKTTRRNSVSKLPYDGKSISKGKGCIYIAKNIPEDLQNIIVHYVLKITS